MRIASQVLLLVALVAIARPAAAQDLADRAPGLALQLSALRAEKAGRSASERKLDSRLLYAARRQRGAAPVPGLPGLRGRVRLDAGGQVRVDLRGRVASMARRVRALGGQVLNQQPARGALRARLPLAAVEVLAAHPAVDRIRAADLAFTRMLNVSQGDVAHRADLARAAHGVDGTGISVGVLSDGIDDLAAAQASGDLPPAVTVLPGQSGSGSEGTAMLEIVHDLAPGAALMFATAFGSQAQFAANIIALEAAGADVIVDDVGYFAEAVFQDDDVADAVGTVAAAGAFYFSSAGNAGNLNDGSSGVFEGDFNFTGTTINGDPAHDFGGGVFANEITDDSPFFFTLQWSDEQGASANDYDLLLVDPAVSVILDASTNVQNGNDDPFEFIDTQSLDDTGNKLIVVRTSGSDRYLHLNTNRGELGIATAGQTYGHPGARDALGVAAVDARFPGGAGGVFDGSESVQSYSSDGPRRVFYEADGTPITPGDFSSSGGELRQKPDLTAGDCVSTATPGFGTFCGTSAAAPHAAAITALLLELGGPGVLRQDVLDALTGTALDIEAPGTDRDSGVGIVDALAAADDLAPPACSNGIDDDGDSEIDFPADPGCDDADDDSETSAALPCDDGLENDSDGLIDFPDDPGCFDLSWPTENPECQDGVDNDSDGEIDWDGGASAGGGGGASPDSNCATAFKRFEKKKNCGLGFELGVLLPLCFAALRRRR